MVFGRPWLAAPATASMSVPRQQLLGFAKVWLHAGETRRVRVEVPVEGMRLVGPGGGRPMLLEGRWEFDIVGGAAQPFQRRRQQQQQRRRDHAWGIDIVP